jgi:endo-1,3(4)-beta-glucanase
MRLKRKVVIGVSLACVLIAVLLIGLKLKTTNQNQPIVSQAAATSLPKRSPNLPSLLLAPGLLTPTNKWYSSLAFAGTPEPVYAYPLSYETTADGYSVSNPPVVSSANAIIATNIPDVTVNMSATKHIVSAYDDLSVVVSQQSAAGSTIATTRITHGSPYVFTEFKTATTVNIATTGVVDVINAHEATITLGERLYGVYSSADLSGQATSLQLNVKEGDLLTLFTYPSTQQLTTYFTDAAHAITRTNVTYNTSSTSIKTTYTIQTKTGNTLFAATPDMSISGHAADYGSFSTILGKQIVYSGLSFTDTQSAPTMPSSELNLNKITASERKDLIAKLTTDTNNLTFTQTDTYYGGKEMYRAANLLTLAEQLNQPKLATIIQTKLAARLSEWLDPNGYQKRSDLYFYYDTSYDGVVGVQASYGSDSFNDHDFHYGYFIYAAAILSKYDPAFYTAHASMVNVLISDIASSEQTSLFPKLRYFDSYVGHSWASGNGEFADGNNQETTSEAINAWYGIYLWSLVSHNSALTSEATWLYAHETTAAKKEWFSVSIPTSQGAAYVYPTAGQVWGDKVTYSTLFSARPQAVLGIQLIPMSPGSTYLKNTDIDKNIASVAPNQAGLVGQFQDYLIMYQALSDPQLALKEASALMPQNLDNANSEAYFYAWLYSQASIQ